MQYQDQHAMKRNRELYAQAAIHQFARQTRQKHRSSADNKRSSYVTISLDPTRADRSSLAPRCATHAAAESA